MESLIKTENFSYAYDQQTPALDNISLNVHKGESIGLIGPNGAGKTTLFLCLIGLVPYIGEGLEVAGLKMQSKKNHTMIRRRMGIVFQHTDDQLFNSTVFDDVAFGLLNMGLKKDEVIKKTRKALLLVGLEGFEEKVPFHLSGGQKRRVCLAGVIAMEPEILLLDEPTSDLDPRGKLKIINILNNLDSTYIISSHDLEFVLKTCKRVIMMDNGKIIADGPAIDIMSDENFMVSHGLEKPHSLMPHIIKHHHDHTPDIHS